MDNFEYSLDALNVKNEFYQTKTIVYVEGDDDVLFWECVFGLVPNFPVKVESVGGSDQLDKYIERISSNEMAAIAARDADFLRVAGKCVSFPRVLYTYGYAIENSVYSTEIIHQMVRAWCKSSKIDSARCDVWLSSLGAEFSELVALDIANFLSDAGVAVLDNNCTRFMEGQSSADPCRAKIALHESAVREQLSARAIKKGRTAVSATVSAPVDNLRGHFLATAVLKFLLSTAKSLNKKITVSADSMYAAAIAHFSRALDKAHPHRQYYLQASLSAANSFS